MPAKKATKKKPAKKKPKKITVEIQSDIDPKEVISAGCKTSSFHGCGCGGFAYFLGFVGALVYYVGTAPSVWGAILGFFKAACGRLGVLWRFCFPGFSYLSRAWKSQT